jgi:hypothetical protein
MAIIMGLIGKISRRSIVASLATIALWPVDAAVRLHRRQAVISPSLPTILSILPSNGDVTGGTSVTLHGNNFSGPTAVSFGGQAAAAVVLVNSTTITCFTPSHVEGTVDVAVTTPRGIGTRKRAYSYSSPSKPITIAFISSPEHTLANPALSIKMPNSYGVGTVIRRQVQVSGGDWSSPVRDVTRILSSAETQYENVAAPMIPLPPHTYDWRVIVNDTQISNVITATV